MNTKKRINDWLLLFNRANILCVGDVMLDQYVYGEVDRVSPEAPIPVLNVGKKERAIGGAGNVVCNIASLGSVGYLLAEIGNDEAGEEIGRLLKTNQKAVPKLLINLGIIADLNFGSTIGILFGAFLFRDINFIYLF